MSRNIQLYGAFCRHYIHVLSRVSHSVSAGIATLGESAVLEALAALVLLFLLALRAVLELPEHAVKLAQLVLLVGDLLQRFGLLVHVVLLVQALIEQVAHVVWLGIELLELPELVVKVVEVTLELFETVAVYTQGQPEEALGPEPGHQQC